MAVARMAHVVVIGGGLAGLSATIESLSLNARVTLIDKHKLGGNSAKATSGMNAAVSRPQKAAGILDDSIDLFVSDIMRSGQGESNPLLVQALAAQSAPAVHFLIDKVGVELTDVNILGGHSVARTHRLKPSPNGSPAPVGFLTTSAMRKYLQQEKFEKSLQIREGCKLVDIILDETSGSAVTKGVKVICSASQGENATEEETIEADAVILATGGFGADLNEENSLLHKVNEKAAKVGFTTNGAWATGDVHKLALKKGFVPWQLNNVQLHPTGFVDSKDPLAKEKFLCPEVVRGVGAILLNGEGRRFVDELSRRDQVSAAILENGTRIVDLPAIWKNAEKQKPEDDPRKAAALLLNDAIRERMGSPAFDFYKSKGFIIPVGDIKGVCTLLGCDEAVLRQSLQEYIESAKGTRKDAFGKVTFPEAFSLDEEDFYVAFVTPSIHYCMGGLQVNTVAQLYGRQGDSVLPVPNLFAVGELAGGLHGKNRLGGNGMLEAVAFGRVAGRMAAKITSTDIADTLKSHQSVAMEVREFEVLSDGSATLSLSFPSLMTSLSTLKLSEPTFDIGWSAETGTLNISGLKPTNEPSATGILKFDFDPTFKEGLLPGNMVKVKLVSE